MKKTLSKIDKTNTRKIEIDTNTKELLPLPIKRIEENSKNNPKPLSPTIKKKKVVI